MSDIVERLLEDFPPDQADFYPNHVIDTYKAERHEAAAEITKLRAELAEAEAVIKPMADAGKAMESYTVHDESLHSWPSDVRLPTIGHHLRAAEWLEGRKG